MAINRQQTGRKYTESECIKIAFSTVGRQKVFWRVRKRGRAVRRSGGTFQLLKE